jgi:hypothetical protein
MDAFAHRVGRPSPLHLPRVKRNPNFPRYGNRKFPTRFTLRPLRCGRGRPSASL